ncbi:helix-turn-helix domain-containing protein [Streptomonospora nanhaiensis]|uniref:Transcriptional regulator with XRE-family HTH domain n=1 Tax=Streptomonospora nanhaiensis TaxID=1323731 RepID=A0A853BU23_9ACTN|nr:helix-turn-helix transcriptional regulator [Streptomonospora nanhaiensis]MBV2366230.1 helix-turn-helix transcriptional regulator [Streptomonospora nanhaiensis]MBX9386947.1 helix-turn-helix transcriptional regulator [Streptomonospora nanhaiensis]NYI98256.1 transcriptional regulator with XRE-family HTH domain [Streptomonospora nanhaiensis]
MGLRQISPAWKKYGSDVRTWRKAARLTLKELAPAVGLSESSLSYVENGKLAPKEDHAQAIDKALHANGKLLLSWDKCANELLVPRNFRKTIDLEKDAIELRYYHPVLVPGLLQTPEYARALFAAHHPQADESTLDRLVQRRIDRQQIFNRDERPIVHVVLDEAVLYRVVGGSTVMKAQLARIVELVEKRWVQCQVLPTTAQTQPGLPGAFRVLVFELQVLVASEHAFDEVIIDEREQDQLRKALSVYGRLQGEALSPHESLDLIRKLERSQA